MDLSPAVKQFAAEHEMEIKRRCLSKKEEYYLSTTSTDYESKWDKGCVEHGEFTEKKFNGVDWFEQQVQEWKDEFWFETLQYAKELGVDLSSYLLFREN